MEKTFKKRTIFLTMGIAIFSIFFAINRTYADERIVSEDIFNNSVSMPSDGLDISQSIVPNKKARSGSSFEIDIEEMEKSIIESYKESYDWNGDVKIIDYDDYNPNNPEDSPETTLKDILSDSVNTKNSRAFVNSHGNPSIAYASIVFKKPNGQVIIGHGSAFKVNATTAGTAGHLIYDSENGLGWANDIALYFGQSVGSDGRLTYTSVYLSTQLITNNDWVNNNYNVGRRSDFGSIKMKKVYGTTPGNLGIVTNPPANVSSVSAYGYPSGGSAVRSTGSVYTPKYTNTFDWIYESSTAKLRGGMSGGPLLNNQGKVIGINVATADGSGNGLYVKTRSTVVNHFK